MPAIGNKKLENELKAIRAEMVEIKPDKINPFDSPV